MIMNRNNQIFGVIENVEENNDYNGSSTDTAVVTVDNVNREIRVDVNFEGMLGETNKTAYPGDKGEHTRWLVLHVEDEVEAEIERAKQAETEIKALIQNKASDAVMGDIRVEQNVHNTLLSYATKQYVSEELTRFSTTLSTKVVDDVDIENNKIIVDGQLFDAVEGTIYLVKSKTAEGDDFYKQHLLVDGQLTLVGDTSVDLAAYAKITFVEDVATNLTNNIQQVQAYAESVQKDVDDVEASVENVKNTYATKEDLRKTIADYSRSSRQVVSSINLEKNTVVIDGAEIDAVVGTVYLVPEDSTDVEHSYKQYTLVENRLTLISGTKIDLADYATIAYVDDKIKGIDLTDYAKQSDVDNISKDVATVKSTYSTKEELNKALEDYSNSSKVVISAVNLDNNTVVIGDVSVDAVAGVTYLIAEVTNDGENSYKQYALINNKLTLIGGTQIDLSDYAKVDDIPDVINQALQAIKFIDGGTSTTIKF